MRPSLIAPPNQEHPRVGDKSRWTPIPAKPYQSVQRLLSPTLDPPHRLNLGSPTPKNSLISQVVERSIQPRYVIILLMLVQDPFTIGHRMIFEPFLT